MARYAGNGVKLQYKGRNHGDTLDVYTDIAQVMDVSGPSLTTDTQEATDRDSPDNYKNHLVTWIDAGEVTFSVNFDPDDDWHANKATAAVAAAPGDNPPVLAQGSKKGLPYILEQRTLEGFRITLPGTNNHIDFNAFVTNFAYSEPLNGVLTADATFKIDGKPTLPS